MANFISRIVAFFATILVGIVVNYIFLPAWSFNSSAFYFYLLIMAIVAILFFGIADRFDEIYIPTIICVIITGIILLTLIIGWFTSCTLFHAMRYQSLIEIEEGNFAEEVVSNNIDEIAVVDVATAQRLGDRTIASLENPSWYDVDNEYNLILYNGKQYRLSPINYGGFFKYNRAKAAGIPGYVLVDAITQEANLITLENPIKYSPSAYFSYDLTRHLRNQYSNYVFGKSFFEIDEEGNPYWITSVKETNIGLFGGKTENSFIITDACTGESTEYSVEDLPEWVDHAFDLEYLMDMIYYNYEYINGILNFSKTGVNRTSYYYSDSDFAGYNTTISSDGIVFYTSVTPANAAESINGFILASPRTGILKYYSCFGAEESSAQAAAEGLVQNLGYTATFPTVVNIDGTPTYFMTLKDGAGLIQRYAFCNVENYSIVVQDYTLEGAINSYRVRIGTLDTSVIDASENSITTESNEGVEFQTISTFGEITSLYTAEIGGYTYYIFTLANDTNLYMSSIENNYRQVLLQVGTNVNIEYVTESEIMLVKSIEF